MKYRYLKNYDQSLSTIIANIMKFITVYDQVAYALESILYVSYYDYTAVCSDRERLVHT